MVSPGEFIPIFEKNGLISDVDMYIWEVACKLLRKWKDQGREDLYISVNISPRDFYFLNVYQIFTELVEKYEIDPQNLKLEITETAIVMDLKRQMELIGRLRQTGFIVEMDDFGSGYSSLNMLGQMSIDILKLDMMFIRNELAKSEEKSILGDVINMVHRMQLEVVAEGVETSEQQKRLQGISCDYAQGYFYAKPMPENDFEKILAGVQ